MKMIKDEVKDNVDTRTLNTISLCSGYEGIGLGLREVVRTLARELKIEGLLYEQA